MNAALLLLCLSCQADDGIGEYLRSIRTVNVQEPRKRLLVFLGADSRCYPCRLTRVELKRLRGWKVGPGNTGHIQTVDADSDLTSLGHYGVTATPTFILVEGGEVTYRHEGYLGYLDIAKIYNKGMPGQKDHSK